MFYRLSDVVYDLLLPSGMHPFLSETVSLICILLFHLLTFSSISVLVAVKYLCSTWAIRTLERSWHWRPLNFFSSLSKLSKFSFSRSEKEVGEKRNTAIFLQSKNYVLSSSLFCRRLCPLMHIFTVHGTTLKQSWWSHTAIVCLFFFLKPNSNTNLVPWYFDY